MVVVADGTEDAAERLERVLTTDPGTGVMRHVDAGYPEALAAAEVARPRAADAAQRTRMRSPGGERRLLIRDLAQLATPAGTVAPLRGAALGEVEVLDDAYVLCAGDSIEAVGPHA